MKSISRVAPFLFGRFYVRLISELRIIGTAIACTNEYGLFGCSEVLNTKLNTNTRYCWPLVWTNICGLCNWHLWTLPIPISTNLVILQPILTDMGSVSKCHFCVSVTKINSIHWWLITKSVWCTLPISFRTNSRTNKLQPIWTDLGPIGASFSHLITQPACGWLQNQLNGDCLYLSRPTQPNISPFRLIWAH